MCGDRIAWDGYDGATQQIWVADANGDNSAAISDVGAGNGPTTNENPAWSPAGNRITWAGSDGTTRQIWVADANGNNRTTISDIGAGPVAVDSRNPKWSPGGSRIAWAGFDDNVNNYQLLIWASDPDGNNRTKISDVGIGTDPTINNGPQWMPCPAECAAPVHPFSDVPASSFAKDDITCIKNLGITTGTTATTYDPAGTVTREQMAAFLARTWRQAQTLGG